MKNMPVLPQDSETTCWYTCLTMMFLWKGRDPDEIKPALVKAGILWDDATKTGLKTKDYFRAAKALGLTPWGTSSSWSATNFASFCAVSPCWVAGKWYDNSHNVVVIGASRKEIRFIDPYWETSKEATIRTWFENDFVHGKVPAQSPGTDFYQGWVGAVMTWGEATPAGIVPE
ncbi:papain-like cysteine protease family protein [Rhodovarius crocodyli]|nr:papain-like cysteine protease family protein [Rhodovarius crocodyli]